MYVYICNCGYGSVGQTTTINPIYLPFDRKWFEADVENRSTYETKLVNGCLLLLKTCNN